MKALFLKVVGEKTDSNTKDVTVHIFGISDKDITGIVADQMSATQSEGFKLNLN